MNWKVWILGIYEMIDGLVKVLSLGRICTNLSYKWIFLVAKKEFRRKQQELFRR